MDMCAFDDFSFDAIEEHIFNYGKHQGRAGDDIINDTCEMVAIGLIHQNTSLHKLKSELNQRGFERIKKLVSCYKISTVPSSGNAEPLKSDSLTFARAITCFSHVASLLLYKDVKFVINGEKSCLASERLPNAMKHSGFCGLIPKCSDPYLKKAYMYAHAAYMVEFCKLMGDKRSLKAMALSQLECSMALVEKLPYDDVFRVEILGAVGLTYPGGFRKVIDVCNNLCKVIGEAEVSFVTAVKDHVKNNMVCFFEDGRKDVAASTSVFSVLLAEKLRVTGIHDSSTSKN